MEDAELGPEGAADEDVAAERQCGRCQLMFPGDPASHRSAQLGWWLCPPCREALTGHQSPGRF